MSAYHARNGFSTAAVDVSLRHSPDFKVSSAGHLPLKFDTSIIGMMILFFSVQYPSYFAVRIYLFLHRM
jgi:hypothetical protein